MNMVTGIAYRNMKYHKSKNILTGAAVFLTTLLLFLVPAIGADLIGAQHAVVNEIYPSWYALYRNIDEDTLEKLKTHHEIADYGLRNDTGYLVSDEAEISMIALDNRGFALYNLELAEGRLPRKADEIVVTEGILEEMGQTGQIGDRVTLPYQIIRNGNLDYAKEKEFVITGFLEDSEESIKSREYTMLVSEEFVKEEIPAKEIRWRFLFQTETNRDTTTEDIEGKVHDIAAQAGITESDTVLNKEYLQANYVDPTVTPVIIMILLIIAAAGVITIYSIYYVGMAEFIREFGRIKAIGATKKQLKQIVLREGFAVACIAVPLGLLVGTVSIRGIFAFILNVYQQENPFIEEMKILWTEGKIEIYHLWSFLLAAGVAFITVWLSLLKPMRAAAAVSEIEAIRFQGENRKRKKEERKSYLELSVFKLVKIHMLGSKKNTFVTIGAMSVTGIFLMVVATVLSCANPAESADNSIIGSYEINLVTEEGNKEHPEREWENVIKNNPLNDELKEKIEAIWGVDRVDTFLTVYAECRQLDEGEWGIEGVPEEYTDVLLDNIVEGTATKEDMDSGDYVIVSTSLLNWIPDVQAGDKLELKIVGETGAYTKEVTIIAVANYTSGFNNDLFMSAEGLKKICNSDIRSSFHVFAPEKYNAGVEAEILKLIEGNDSLHLHTWQADYEQWKQGIVLTSAACYIFLGVLGAICIMNMINTMIYSVHLRKKEIGMMQAIGMSDRQLGKMLRLEGMFYTMGTLILSLGSGSLLGYPVYRWAKYNHFFDISRYHYPVKAALIVAAVLFLVQMAMAFLLSHSVKKETLIERIRYSD